MELSAVAGYDQYTEFFTNVTDSLTVDEYSIVYGYLNLSIVW